MCPDFKLEKFEGPLDFLLQLLDEEKLSITDVALSKVTEQFFSYLDKLEDNRPEELADFLVIAARLIYLKSHHLLNYLQPDEEETGPGLADQLKMYKRYVEASKEIEKLWSREKIAYGRTEPPVKAAELILPLNAQAGNLRDAMAALLSRLRPVSPLPQVTIDHSVSVKQKLDTLRNLLKSEKQFSFFKLISEAKNKTEVIASFLALLELVKEKSAIIKQKNSFEDLIVVKN